MMELEVETLGIKDQKENTRRMKRLEKTLSNSLTSKEFLPSFLTTPQNPVLRSVKYIRWLRNNMFANTYGWQH